MKNGARSLRSWIPFALFIVFSALMITGVLLSACASDATRDALTTSGQRIGQLEREHDTAEQLASTSDSEAARDYWRARAAALERDLDAEHARAEALSNEHDQANQADSATWRETLTTAGSFIPVPGAAALLAGLGGLAFGRRSGATILASAIAAGRAISPELNAAFTNDSDPGVMAMKAATPPRMRQLVQSVNTRARTKKARAQADAHAAAG